MQAYLYAYGIETSSHIPQTRLICERNPIKLNFAGKLVRIHMDGRRTATHTNVCMVVKYLFGTISFSLELAIARDIV